ncbi:MAG: ABC transporter substrate-binding protein [Alphaproteobacteria bacterium]|nr:ABC transporter substrate-binding protein [Alphaproteobacteria bacterium]
MFKKNWLIALAILLGLGNCSKDSSSKSRLIVAQKLSSIITLDPADVFETECMDFIFNTYQRLFKTIGGAVQNDLVESYEFVEGGKILRLTIKKDQYFSSGNVVTAEDVVYSLRRLVLMQKAAYIMFAPLGFTPQSVRQHIREVDPHTVELEFQNPLSKDLVLTCLAASASSILDAALVKEHTVNDDYGAAWLRSAGAGSGPLMLGVWQPGEVLTMKRNPYYEDSDDIKFTTVILRHVGDVATQMLLLKRGEVDIIRDLPQEQSESVDKEKYDLEYISKAQIWYLNLNQSNKYLKNPAVHQAIRHLIDYSVMSKVLGEKVAQPLPTLVPSGFLGHITNPELPEFNPEKAREIIHAEYGGDIEIEFDTSMLALAQVYQSIFAKGGIKLKLNYFDARQAISRLRKRQHQMSLKMFGADYNDPHTFITTFVLLPQNESQAVTFVAWRNSLDVEGLQEMAHKASTIMDTTERTKIYEEIQRRYQKVPLIPLAEIYATILFSKRLSGPRIFIKEALIYHHLYKKDV